ncbi:hypothetical protein IFM89_001906 [Coptis chinensis]|uniref:Orn/DAP/Arg decarboxylase 2 N-terminal domain-containing protein n=1 Tax=Coptis chinensis TaxID=261450 RepID=A0A835M471_9MAGN|nr:hypothetical protein IFM89_001906 [Coptis chinensis]
MKGRTSRLSTWSFTDRIVYANPAKVEAHIGYAASVGVNLTTFDSREEVEKIMKVAPQMFPPNSLKARMMMVVQDALLVLARGIARRGYSTSSSSSCRTPGGIRVFFHVGGGATHSRFTVVQ